jgi:Ca2+-dependent lipid-binding protein
MATTVRVIVSELKAQGLLAADRGGTSDPFAVLRCGSEEFKTEVIKKTLDPVWTRNSFEFGTKQDLVRWAPRCRCRCSQPLAE